MSGESVTRHAFAPGRVNLIGEHTDYTGGLVLPMALRLGVTVEATIGGDRIILESDGHPPADLAYPVDIDELRVLEPSWARFVVAAAEELDLGSGYRVSIRSDLPSGGTGLSSSSALTVAVLLALGAEGSVEDLARTAQHAEIRSTGTEIGLMDQLASIGGIADHALMIDCHDIVLTPVSLPPDLEVLVVHTGQSRELADSAYQQRRQECEAIEGIIGSLRLADLSRLDEIDDPVLRRRARHVISENQRVRAMVEALAADDKVRAGSILDEGHRSLSEDYEVTTPVVDEMVGHVASLPGVYGARLTGGGFGGCLVALCDPGTAVDVETWWTRVRPGEGAHLIDS